MQLSGPSYSVAFGCEGLDPGWDNRQRRAHEETRPSPCAIVALVEDVESWAEVGERIRAARQAADLTQGRLAESITIPRTALVRIEAGEQGLSALVLGRLARRLGIPVAHFLTRSPGPVAAYRAAAAEIGERGQDADTERARFALDVQLEAHARDLQWLHGKGLIRAADDLPSRAVAERADALHLARDARARLGKPREPLGPLATEAERFGLYLKVLDEGTAGASLQLAEGLGVAVIGGGSDPGRRRTTAAHELGHHLFGDRYNTDVGVAASDQERERLIDQFAAELLLPEDVLVGRITPSRPFDTLRSDVVALAGEYRLSWTTAINCARWAGVLDHALAQRLRARAPLRGDFLSSIGYEPQEDLTAGTTGAGWRRAVLAAWSDDLITEDRTVDLLNGAIGREELPARETGVEA